MTGRFRRVDEIPQDQAAVVGANIRVLRQQHGWNQAKLGELMGWPSNSTVCAAEGRRNGRQRGFTTQEVERLAAIFGVSPAQLTTRVRELRRAPADRVRLPDLRSPSPDMKPVQPTGPVQITAGPALAKCFRQRNAALALRRRSSSRQKRMFGICRKTNSRPPNCRLVATDRAHRRRNTCKILPLTVGKFHPALSGHRNRWDNDVSRTVRTARR